MNPISKGLIWKYQKNKHLIDSLIFRKAPEFVYRANPGELKGEIPVFTFHLALPEPFERQCLYLAENGYVTLSADGFHRAITNGDKRIKKTVLLTFDDGLKHVWTVAYPILKKYGLKATCFLIPGCISEEDGPVRPNLDDYWEGNSTMEDVVSFKEDEPKLATWEEIKIMHESGVIDFQSHSLYHSLVFTENEVFDFINPDYDTHFFGNIHIPLYRQDGKDVYSRDAIMGMPVYHASPRMVARRRFFDDEGIRNVCVEAVRREGGDSFFERKEWRSVLKGKISTYRKHNILQERYETEQERDKAVYDELHTSKRRIEEKLPGKRVTQLCFPWYEAGDFALGISKEAGYSLHYFGQIKGKRTNLVGDDPTKIVRVEDLFLERLPGAGRKNISKIASDLLDARKIPAIVGF